DSLAIKSVEKSLPYSCISQRTGSRQRAQEDPREILPEVQRAVRGGLQFGYTAVGGAVSSRDASAQQRSDKCSFIRDEHKAERGRFWSMGVVPIVRILG